MAAITYDWMVELSDRFTETVLDSALKVEDGCLIFTDTWGGLKKAYARGQWATVTVRTDNV